MNITLLHLYRIGVLTWMCICCCSKSDLKKIFFDSRLAPVFITQIAGDVFIMFLPVTVNIFTATPLSLWATNKSSRKLNKTHTHIGHNHISCKRVSLLRPLIIHHEVVPFNCVPLWWYSTYNIGGVSTAHMSAISGLDSGPIEIRLKNSPSVRKKIKTNRGLVWH